MRRVFLAFLFFWLPKTTSKSSFFHYFFENVDFVKIITKHWLCAQKSRFGFEKNTKNLKKIDAEITIEKNIEKNIEKIDFGLHFGSKNPPKIHQKSKKVASEDELKKRVMGLNGTLLRLTAADPASQAQEAS